MNIIFVRTKIGIGVDGTLLLSTLLKQAGHIVKTVFLPRHGPYSQKEFEYMQDLLQVSDLLLISVYSTYLGRAINLTEFTRQKFPNLMIVWGGPHCLNSPEPALRYADAVCYAEGDEVVVPFVNKLAAGQNHLDTPNMAFKINGTMRVNDAIPPLSNLDSLPYPAWDEADLFLLNHGLSTVTGQEVRTWGMDFSADGPTYDILTSRGCTFSCSFCCINQLTSIYNRYPIRFRSIDHFIGELEYTLNRFDFYQYIGFADEDFFMRSKKELERFAAAYKARIGLPFWAQTTPSVFRRDKLEILLDAGLKVLDMGVQSGSQRTLNEVYGRKIPVEKTRQAINQIESFVKKGVLKANLHFILDQPYESKDDIIETYKFLINTSPTINIDIYAAAFFPGTELYRRLIRDGLIDPFTSETFRDFRNRQFLFQNNYETVLVKTAGSKSMRRYPKFLLRALGSRPLRAIASLVPDRWYASFFLTYPSIGERLVRRLKQLRHPTKTRQI